jgi:hypothetical protein
MEIKQALAVINAMEADGVIGRYAIAGAVAAYNYIEPTLTEDLDILVSFGAASAGPRSGLITLAPIFAYLKAKGYEDHRREGLLIEGWPVQFLPVASDLDAEALAQAQEVEIRTNDVDGSVWTRVLRAEHLVATCLRVGRPKDFIRAAQFLEEHAVDIAALCEVLRRHGLSEACRAFCRRAGIADPCQT